MKTLTLFLLFLFAFGHGQTQDVVLSGIENGPYQQIAKDIKALDSTIIIETTGGSIANFQQMLKRTDVRMAFVQNDVLLYQKYIDEEQDVNTLKDVRVLLPLGREVIHILIRNDDDIARFKDLKKKRVAIGSRKQGSFVTANIVKKIGRLKWTDVYTAFEESLVELQAGKVDAVVFVGAMPVNVLMKLDESYASKIKFLEIPEDVLRDIYFTENDNNVAIYQAAFIPAGTYPWADYDVSTFSVMSLLVKNIARENEEEHNATLATMKKIYKNRIKLRKKGHEIWKEVDFDFSEIDFPIYDGVKYVYKRR